MKTFAINTLGCKVNQYESQQIRELLERLGLVEVEAPESEPDLTIINTCCVTHTASAKSRQYIRKAQKLSPDAVIVACGCLPTVQIGELNNSSKNFQLIRHRKTIAATLRQIVNGKAGALNSQSFQTCQNTILIKAKNSTKIKCKNKLANSPELAPLTSFKGHTRAFLKIQDGCDGYCTYCIVPKTRPYVHSKSAEMVLKEAQALVGAGHKEIVVTGIFLGAYGQKSVRRKNWSNRQNRLADLLDKMGEIPNLARIRLSSLEPGDVTQRLLDTFCKHRNIMPHLHLSLQSGSDAVLKRMRRQYGTEEFLRAVELIKSQLDRPAITTDIIVGFPGETDADFEATVNLAREAGFAKMHVFSFSPRAGTAAAEMQGAVNSRVIKSRSQTLRDLNSELEYKFRQQFIGEKDECKGRSKRYFVVRLEKTNGNLQKGGIVRVKLVENSKNGVIGRVEKQAIRR
jgi:threonylcarbamoyladenosine tRNA methylthiotransferase MtaB